MDNTKKAAEPRRIPLDGMKRNLERFAESVLDLASKLTDRGGKPLSDNEKQIIRMVGFNDFKQQLEELEIFYLRGKYEDMNISLQHMAEQSSWITKI